jgi:hypothetical protein
MSASHNSDLSRRPVCPKVSSVVFISHPRLSSNEGNNERAEVRKSAPCAACTSRKSHVFVDVAYQKSYAVNATNARPDRLNHE